MRLEFPTRRISFDLQLDRNAAPRAAELLESYASETYAHHAKRDGQLIFTYLDTPIELELEQPRTEGVPGDALVFPGNPDATGRERLAQLVIVYGPDNLFVEPLDEDIRPRAYGFVGQIADTEKLRWLGDEIWRAGLERLRIGSA
jgi:hypothetical protein